MRAPTARGACCRRGALTAAAAAAGLLFACEPSPATRAGPGQPKPSAAGSPSKAAGPERIQFNGTYRGVMQDQNGTDVGIEYLRFSSDGTVMSLSSAAPLDGGVDEKMALRTGTFTASGNILTFATTGPARKMEYAGTIRGDELLLKWRVEKENKLGSALFTFVPEAASDAAPGAAKPAEASPPNEAFKPAGTTWFCTRARDAPAMSHCERTVKACQSFRKEILTKLPKDKFSDCVEQPKAACHTMIDKLAKKGIAFCYQHISDCEEAGRQIRRNENPADYEVSDCTAW
jgi:hypothetical protein